MDALFGVAHLLCNQVIPQSLQSLSSVALKLIQNASADQIETAIAYNQHEINTLLIQLLAINFINKNQNEMKYDVNLINNKNDTTNDQLNDDGLKEYCEHKLLDLSPVGGFSRKNYFVECNLSNDVRIEILSYLKPIEIFKNISLLNKQFNKNVLAIHQCCKHANMFCNKNFTFESFDEIERSWDQYKYDVDWRMSNGQWVLGEMDKLNMKTELVHLSADMGDVWYSSELNHHETAPPHTMAHRPGNISRLVNLMKHGYLSAACDVNLKQFCWTLNDKRFHIISGYVEDINSDVWQCGWIDFGWTWKEAVERNDFFKNDKNENFPENSQNKFRLFQIGVTVDITEAYNAYDIDQRESFRSSKKLFRFGKVKPNQCLITVVFHIDDIENITYFGHKTTLEQQLKTKQQMFDDAMISYISGQMSETKRKLLDAVDYPNYCVATRCGRVFDPYAISILKNEQEKQKYEEWCRGTEDIDAVLIYERECIRVPTSQKGVDKVYYDKTKDELLVKTVPWYALMLDDKNAPSPLKKRYILKHDSKCKLIEAKIIDSKLIDKVKNENIDDVTKKEKRYFELLKEWKGCIDISIDITKEFDQFQEKLKHDYFANNRYHSAEDLNRNDDDDNPIDEWDNRKYFLGSTNYDLKQDKITFTIPLLLDSERIYSYDDKFNFFHVFGSFARASYNVLAHVFEFAVGNDSTLFEEQKQVALVCKKWYCLCCDAYGYKS